MNKKIPYIILGIVVISSLVAIGISLRKPAIVSVEGPSVPSPTEEAVATPTEEVVEAPAELPPETPPIEIPGLSSCIVLDEEYCKKAEVFYLPDWLFVAFNLPKGTKVYAPADGIYGGQGGFANVKQTSVILPPFENGLRFKFAGVVSNPELEEEVEEEFEEEARKGITPDPERFFEVERDNQMISMLKLKKGELIGTISGEKIILGGIYGPDPEKYPEKRTEYTMMITVTKGDHIRFEGLEDVSNQALIDVLSPYFPYLK